MAQTSNDISQIDSQTHNIFESKHRELIINIENKKFKLNLDNLNEICVEELDLLFKNNRYSIEELLTLCINLIRDKSVLQIKSNELLQEYKRHV